MIVSVKKLVREPLFQSGFSNSMTSSALEAKSEGLVTGIGANMFKLGGTVITFGIVASFILGGIRYVISLIW